MSPVLIVYATREGHTRRIAEYVAKALQARAVETELVSAREIRPGWTPDRYSAAILAASVHIGKHEKEIVRFAKSNARALETIPTMFLSVSLSQAGAEDPAASPENRARSAQDVKRMIADFLKETGWRPARIQPVAGALLYTKYNFLVRFVMKRIAAHTGGSTDASRDHVYTNWDTLENLAAQLADNMAAKPCNAVKA